MKATRKSGKTRISPNERRRLKIQARKTGATPVHADVSRDKVRYKSVRTKRKLKPWKHVTTTAKKKRVKI